jgi:hypothetical protein
MSDANVNPSVASARGGVAVTKSDATTYTPTRGVWVGGAGNLAVVFADQSTAVTLVGVAAGTLLPIAVIQIMSTNTTATDIVALW